MGFKERLANGDVLIFDGAMGSMLLERGVDGSDGNPNLKHPQVVQDVHRAYIEAGSDCIITNTFSLNEIYMAKQGHLDILDDAVKAGVENALEASQGRAFVIGDLGPAGELLAPYGPGDPEAFAAAYRRLATSLAAMPIDALVIETVFQWAEVEIMLKACKEVAPQLPVLCSMTFTSAAKGGRTLMGDQAADVAAKAAALGAAAVGSNCGDLTPLEQAVIMKEMSGAGIPLILQPNAGKPRLEDGKVFYDITPEQYAEQMLECKKAGAQLMGACCGTTPAYINALAKALGR